MNEAKVLMCTECSHLKWDKKPEDHPMAVLEVYEQGTPYCSNGKAWKGVDGTCLIGVPLLISHARHEGAACGPDGNLWEVKT